MNGFKAFKSLIKESGLLGVYRGIQGPVATIPLVNAVIFSSYQLSKKQLEKLSWLKERDLLVVFLAGAFSGVTNSLLITPIELIKT